MSEEKLELPNRGRWACENFDAEKKKQPAGVLTGCVDTSKQPKLAVGWLHYTYIYIDSTVNIHIITY